MTFRSKGKELVVHKWVGIVSPEKMHTLTDLYNWTYGLEVNMREGRLMLDDI